MFSRQFLFNTTENNFLPVWDRVDFGHRYLRLFEFGTYLISCFLSLPGFLFFLQFWLMQLRTIFSQKEKILVLGIWDFFELVLTSTFNHVSLAKKKEKNLLLNVFFSRSFVKVVCPKTYPENWDSTICRNSLGLNYISFWNKTFFSIQKAETFSFRLKKNFVKPHEISAHSDNFYFHFFYLLSDWVEILWGITKFFFKQRLKILAFYLENKIFFRPLSKKLY